MVNRRLLLRIVGPLLASAIVTGACTAADEPSDPTDGAGVIEESSGGGTGGADGGDPAPSTTLGPIAGSDTSRTRTGTVELVATEVATGLDTVWSLAWDPQGRLWFTERGGRLHQLDGPTVEIPGVASKGEGGLMGLEIAADGTQYLMLTSPTDNRVARRDADGSLTVLVDGIRKAGNHNGGRIRLGPDGTLYASTGDASEERLSRQRTGLNGRVLAIDPSTGEHRTFAYGLRNTQGLCFAPDGQLFSTEHGPTEGDEINILSDGFNGRWPDRTGNGIKNWTPTIAPAGCTIYDGDLIPEWKGSLLFVTLKERDLRRLTLDGDRVVAEEVLFDQQFGRLRDVAVGPDGAVYIATSNKDGRGQPRPGDDRILRIAPVRS